MERDKKVVENPINAGIEAALDRFLAPLIEDPSRIESIGDLGCAHFFEAPVLRRYFPNARIVGVDINSQLLAQARQANYDVEGVEYEQADLEKDETVSGEPFDLVVFRRIGPTGNRRYQNVIRRGIRRLKERGFVLATFANEVSYDNFYQILEEFSPVRILDGGLDLLSSTETFAVACEIKRATPE